MFKSIQEPRCNPEINPNGYLKSQLFYSRLFQYSYEEFINLDVALHNICNLEYSAKSMRWIKKQERANQSLLETSCNLKVLEPKKDQGYATQENSQPVQDEEDEGSCHDTLDPECSDLSDCNEGNEQGNSQTTCLMPAKSEPDEL